jgi:hypothetical protein
MPGPAAAASAFPFPAAVAAAQRDPRPLQHLFPGKKSLQRGRGSLSRLQPRGTDGWIRLGSSSARCWAKIVAAVVLLCLSCAVSVAAAQQALCSSDWSTAALSVARFYLAATSLPNEGLAMFAGGSGL